MCLMCGLKRAIPMKSTSAIHRLTRHRNNVRCAPRNTIRAGAACCARAALTVLLTFSAMPCFAGIEIKITGVTEALENNVRTFISMTRYANRDDLDAEVVARLGRRIPTEVRKALEPLGYYSAAATYTVESKETQWLVQITIEPGRAVRISQAQVEISGAGATDPGLQAIIKRSDLHPGARLDHGVYESVKAELLRTATNNGYLDAKLTRHEMIVDAVERRASVSLTLDTGEQYRFGVITIEQPVLHEKLARRILRMQAGDPYSLNAVLESQYLFDDTQYFSAVEFEPGEANRDTHEVPLAIRANANKRNRYSISGGYGTDTQVRGKLTWDNRFVNHYGHRSQMQLTGSSIVEEASAKYVVPVMDVALEKVEVGATYRKEDFGDYLSRKKELAFGLTQVLSTWQRVVFIGFSNETNEPKKVDPAAPPKSSTPAGETYLIIPGISFATLPPTILQREPRRYSLYAVLTGSPETLGSDASFLQLRIDAERVFKITPQWRTRVRGQMGITWTDDFDAMPLSHRFFAGGDNSVRGYGLNELSPVVKVEDSSTPPIITEVRTGGPYLLVGSIELERDLPTLFGVNNLSAATFIDAGNAFKHSKSFTVEYSVGVGIRYRLVGIASIGIDVAQSLSDTDRSPRVHLSLNTLL
jgi:translocation and assembly module TamA